MAEIFEPDAVPKRRAGREDWPRLLRCARVDEALDQISAWLPARLHLVLETASAPTRELASHGRPSGAVDSRAEETVSIAGSPAWRLRALLPDGFSSQREKLRRAGAALEAWRAARDEFARSEARLEARTRELDLLAGMSRRVAEARTAEDLFAIAADVLRRAGGEDLVAVVHALGGVPDARVFLGRPMSAEDVEREIRCAGHVLGWRDASLPPPGMEWMEGFDPGRGCRDGIREQDRVVLPLSRGENIVAVLLVVPSRTPDEPRMRLFWSAANQVSLHLDRILTLREAEEGRFRAILDSMPQAVILMDTSLRIVLSNSSTAELLTRTGLLWSSNRIERIGELSLRDLATEILAGVRSNAGGEARLQDVVLDVTLSALAGVGGRPEGLVLVLADVTYRRKLQSQLAQSEKLSSLGQMISGIAHELNNPLASVLGYAQLVHASAGDERLTKRLEVIHREARRCQKIVSNLLSFARRHEPERKPLSVNEVVEAVLGLMAYQLRVDGANVRSELDSSLPALLGDAHQLQQALLNLVTNAQHAIRSRETGGNLVVRTSLGRPGWIELDVEDDGPGIPEKIRSRIFDPFFTTKSAGEGTGLGLSIVYGIVSAHGGTIRLEERAGAGTLFRIELPIGAPPASAGPAEMLVASVDGMPKGRILVVDDEEPVARLICEALAEDGHAAVAARGGAEALDRLGGAEFDLVISDMKMPGMTVERMRREMDRLRPGLSRRLLLTTGDTLSREADSLAAQQGLPLLHKPFDLDDLRGTVRSWLRTNRERGSCDT